MDRRTISIAILCAFCIGLPLRLEIDVNAAKGENMKLMAASPVAEIDHVFFRDGASSLHIELMTVDSAEHDSFPV